MRREDFEAAVDYNRGLLGDVHAEIGAAISELALQYQDSHSLTVDGKIGPRTLEAIDADIRRRIREETPANLPRAIVRPLRRLPDGRAPFVTSAHGSVNPERRNHPGADLLYRWLPNDPPTPIGDSGRTPGYWIPRDTYACCQADGEIEICGPTRTGIRVWIRHVHGWATGYFHLDKLAKPFRVGEFIAAGDLIGRVGDNPIDHDPDHLHVELWRGDLKLYDPRKTYDPAIFLAKATLLS